MRLLSKLAYNNPPKKMKKISRRQFLKHIGAGAAVCASMPIANACASITTPENKKTPVPTFSGITDWADKDFYEIVSDLSYIVADLQKQCKGNFLPRSDKFILGIPESFAHYIYKVNAHGRSVSEFIKNAWPNSKLVFGKDDCMYASVFIHYMFFSSYYPVANLKTS